MVVYLSINLTAWVLGAIIIRGLAGIGQYVVLELRKHLFGHLSGLSLNYYSRTKAGWIIARLTSDVDAVSDVLSEGLAALVANGLTFCVAVIGLFVLDWRLGLVDAGGAAAGDRLHPLVPAPLARRVHRGADAHRRS